METVTEIFGKPIFKYTGEQAVNDGVLVDVTDCAKEAGIKWPVRITNHLHETINPPETSYDDFAGRLWDVLFLAAVRCKNARPGDPGPLQYQVKIGAHVHTLWVAIDGTNGYPALHIMHPEDY